jgi:diguanylate cyclase (GGDEF)-like protein
LVLRGVALATIPVVLGVQRLSGNPVGGLTLAVVGTVIAVLVTVRSGRSAAEHARAAEALLHRATHDPLTGLPNRAEFMTRLAAELSRPYRCMVLFCDLDGFKLVNDRLGHAAGDRLLMEVGRRLQECVRERDTVARFGGDEFVILYRETGGADAGVLCDRIMAVVECPVVLGDTVVEIGASIGAAVGTGGVGAAGDVESYARQLVHQADTAMYGAKKRRARKSRADWPDELVNTAQVGAAWKWLPTDVDTRTSFPMR